MTFLKEIECFLTVARTLNFTQASEELFMSQPTVSRHIKHLEEYLNLKLFYRNKNMVCLTPSGIIMLQTFTEILGFIQDQKKIAEKMAFEEQGIIKIGFLTQANVVNFFSELFCTFQQLYPNIELNYTFTSYNELERKLKNKELDLVFTPDFTTFESNDIIFEKFCQTNAFLVYGVNHPLAKKENPSFLDFKNERFYTGFPKPITSKFWKTVFSFYKINVWKTECTNSFDAGLFKVFMGEGVTILDPVTVHLDENSYKTIPIPNEVSTVYICVGWLKNNYNTSLPLLLNMLTNPSYRTTL